MKSRTNILNKLIKLLALPFALALPVFMLQSCHGTCVGCVHGTCQQSTCQCQDGYEGSTCNNTWAAKFIGTYEGTDCHDSGNSKYVIGAANSPDSIKYNNKYRAGIKDGETLIFPDQKITEDGVTFVFSGNGKLTSAGLHLELYSDYPNIGVIKCVLDLDRVN
ncbi:hypothetical protein GC194_01595 [bacterium]|nr:hypothetical protein [bacterium]